MGFKIAAKPWKIKWKRGKTKNLAGKIEREFVPHYGLKKKASKKVQTIFSDDLRLRTLCVQCKTGGGLGQPEHREKAWTLARDLQTEKKKLDKRE